ncbi:MAG: beta-propeller domain-containing protein [Micromonosporaceae bacterium]
MRNTTRGTAATLASGLALTIGLAGCTATASYDDTDPGAPPQLVAFDSCGAALKDFKRAARPYVGPYGFGFGGHGYSDNAEADSAAGAGRDSAPQAPGAPADKGGSAPDHSGTNVHEAGVDEPDLVKTDGRRIVTVADGVLRVVDVATRKQTGTLRLPHDGGQTYDRAYAEAGQLLMYGDRALVVLSNPHVRYDGGGPVPGAEPAAPGRADPEASAPELAIVGVELVQIDLAGTPRIISRMKLDGEYVDARAVGGTVRLVTRSAPRVPFAYPDGSHRSEARAQRDNRITLERTTIADWLPRYEIDNGRTVTRGQVGCQAVSRPTAYTGTSMLTVTTLGLEASALSGKQAVSIVADGSTVYGTGKTLYVASAQHQAIPVDAVREPESMPKPRTNVYKFDTSRAGTPRFTAAGSVPGWLINQYAMSEHDGYLRLATTVEEFGGAAQPRSQSAVYVLAHDGKKLTTVGRLGGLGKSERIYAVRFSGPVGYVVTFRQTDPLYTVDLRDPRSPKLLGELKIPGFSAYLHPAAAGRLIGVGQEANEQGQVQGTQVSLFDVSDLSAPRRLAQYHVKAGHSEAEYDPHAFLYWPKTGLLVIPVVSYGAERAEPDKGEPVVGALVLKLSGDSFTEVGTIAHPNQDYRGAVRRSLIIGDTLWTVSSAGLLANDAETLQKQAWISFQ